MDLAAHHRWWSRSGGALVNAVLRDEWNPIGLDAAGDEYRAYAGTVGRLLAEGADPAGVAVFLSQARSRMGVGADDVADRRAAQRIVAAYAAGVTGTAPDAEPPGP